MAVVRNEYVEVTFKYFSYRFNMGNGINSKEKKVRKNLIQIQIQVHKVQGHYQYHHIDRYRDRLSQPENNNIITYDLDALKEIKHVTKEISDISNYLLGL